MLECCHSLGRVYYGNVRKDDWLDVAMFPEASADSTKKWYVLEALKLAIFNAWLAAKVKAVSEIVLVLALSTGVIRE